MSQKQIDELAAQIVKLTKERDKLRKEKKERDATFEQRLAKVENHLRGLGVTI